MPHNYHELWRSWAFEPLIVIGLIFTLLLYICGAYRMYRTTKLPALPIFYFLSGWVVLVIALISPLHRWGRVLFSAHMGQHELLMLVAAPLLVLSRPLPFFLAGLPSPLGPGLNRLARRPLWDRFWGFLTIPFVAWIIHGVSLWIWHLPIWFQAALHSEFIHAIQHIMFLLTSTLFWWSIIHGQSRKAAYGMAVLFMFTTAMHSGLLGALLTFGNSLWYQDYSSTTSSWGISALRDQQLAGLIMWIPACLVYIIAGLALIAGWMQQSERNVIKWEKGLEGSKIIFLILAFLPLLSCHSAPPTNRIFVSNERDGKILVIDSKTDEVISTIETNVRARGIRLSPDQKKLYAALSSPMKKRYNPDNNKIIEIDTDSGDIRATYKIGSDPEQLSLDKTGKIMYASNEDAGTATAIDLKTGKILYTWIVGIEPEGVTTSPDGKWVYVTSETSSTVSVINTVTHDLITSFLVDARPRDTAFSPNGKIAYVSAEVGKSLSVVDALSHRVKTVIPLGTDDNVKPMGVAVSPDGMRVYVALGRANAVAVIDTAANKVLQLIPVGKRPWGIGITGDGKKLYTANGLSNTVSVVDLRSNKVIKTIQAGDGPWGIAIQK
jgi:putative membrane protein